ncbi:MAG: class I adenylate-forming enzyme family protein [Thermodesulfobacteriota bacterium]
MRLLGDILRLNAKRFPEKKALIMEEKYLTYDQLNRQANRLAHALISMDVKPGDRVAILAYNCLEYVTLYYAALKCGSIVVPLNFRYKRDELIYAVNKADPSILFFGPEFASLVESALPDFPPRLSLVSISGETIGAGLRLESLLEKGATSEPPVEIDPDSACTSIFTSGTTGFPKGVLMSHAAWLNTYTGIVVEGDVHPEDVAIVCMPLFHGGGMHVLLQPTFLRGGTAVLMGKGFDPERFLATVQRYHATLTLLVPTQLAMLVQHGSGYDVRSLKKVWYGSAPISPQVLEASIALFVDRFYQWYGQTETGMVVVLRPEDHRERAHCTGREVFNSDIRVVDEDGQDTPVGEVGEIVTDARLGGMIGYLNMPESDRETMQGGWIHTGDLAKVEEGGYLTIVDRKRDMIISGGENIYPKEIEHFIGRHPGVDEVAVIGIPDDIWGESVCAVIVKKKGYSLEESEIIHFCASSLSGYKKPKRIQFIDELPRNAVGKITKNVLREPYWAGRAKRI